MKATMVVVSCLLILITSSALAQDDTWRPFKMGLIEGTSTAAQTQVEDVRFETISIGRGNLQASVNVKDLADESRAVQVSIALFDVDRELLCANITSFFGGQPDVLQPREAKSMKLNFGECGLLYAHEGQIRFFQVGVYSKRSKGFLVAPPPLHH